MPYIINFSDPVKTDTITVPDMPPGINSVDTSLSLVGKGYPNYGQKLAENLVRLLENFASPIPPQNPIEGQLWYDTSDPNKKVLRIMDGTATFTRWPNANGIYQQGTDPAESATQGLKVGDIWVDTSSNQLKIWNSNQWTLVGPSDSGPEQTGSIPATIRDTIGNDRKVILNRINGTTVSIIANEQFTPQAVINGFTVIEPGINISTVAPLQQPIPVLNGISVKAQNLIDTDNIVFPTREFLRKNDQTSQGQIIEGLIRFKTPSTNTALLGQGRDGVVIINGTTNDDANYVQFYKGQNDAIILNNTENGKIIFKVKTNSLNTVLELSDQSFILTGNGSISKTLTVNTLTVISTLTNSLSIAGSGNVAKNLEVGQNFTVSGLSTFTGNMSVTGDIVPTVNGTKNLGSLTYKFRQVYADIIGTTGSVFTGIFNGSARSLQQATEFRIRGQITGTSVIYNGTSTSATFFTVVTPSIISSQTVITTSSSNLNLMVLNTVTNTLNQISRDNFLSAVFPTGVILAYGTSTSVPSGWLLCNGQEYIQTGTYTNLYSLIGSVYGSATVGYFRVPNMTRSTTATNSTTFISYIIKI